MCWATRCPGPGHTRRERGKTLPSPGYAPGCVGSVPRSTKKNSKKEEKSKDTTPTVFTAAGLLAFSEEDAVFRIKPIHVMMITIGFIAAVVLFSLI